MILLKYLTIVLVNGLEKRLVISHRLIPVSMRNNNIESNSLIGTNVNLDTLGLDSRCTGYTGADMSALVREASMAALKDRLKMNIKDA